VSDLEAEIRDNNSQRLPCALVLDCSGSMAGTPIDQLNDAVSQLTRALNDDPTARRRVQLMVVRCGGGVNVEAEWRDVANFQAPTLTATGDTPLGRATLEAVDRIEQQVEVYKKHGVPYLRPWMFIITDGSPTDPQWADCADKVRGAIQAKKLIVYPFGIAGADMNNLAKFQSPGGNVWNVDGVDFRELFQWLSRSASAASRSAPGASLQIEQPPGKMMTVPT
jgi:uncharacterized protein YegL